MAHPSKRKGDKAELEAVRMLCLFAPDLVMEKANRMLGAGRKDDVGDLRVFEDVAIQVKAYANVSNGLRQATNGAIVQGERAGSRFAIGMVPIPRAPRDNPLAVRWLACCFEWPHPEDLDALSVGRWGATEKAVEWLRLKPTASRPDVLAVDQRLALIERKGQGPMFIATVQTWLAAYRKTRIDVGGAA